MMKIFEEYSIRNLSLRNRIVMPPMCSWSADGSGLVNPKHFVHYVTRAVGGVGLIIVEATAVSPEGRIRPEDLGIWNDAQGNSFKELVDYCHQYGARMASQIAHAGRKGYDRANIVAPSPLAFSDDYGIPHELTRREILQKVEEFKAAAVRAVRAGFDMIEVHAAHGYLIHEFLSPLTNRRTDEFGGSLENRVRFLRLILEGIRETIPENIPLDIRVSASDYTAGGIDVHEMVNIIRQVKRYLDLVHVSSGGLTENLAKAFPGYQVEFSRIIREQCGIPTIAVGLIDTPNLAEEIIRNGHADLVALGRTLLRNPYWALNAAHSRQLDSFVPNVVFKYDPTEEITDAVLYAADGKKYICESAVRFPDKEASSSLQPTDLLTPMERSILHEIALSKTTKEIAWEKNLSFHTVNTHRKNIFRKLKVNNVHEAIRYAVCAGIIEQIEYIY